MLINFIQEDEIIFIKTDVLERGKPYHLLIAPNVYQEPLGYLQYYTKHQQCYIKTLEGSATIKTLLEIRLMERVPSRLIQYEL